MLGDFSYSNPTKLYFGEHSLEGLRKELPAYGKNVLLVYGGGSIPEKWDLRPCRRDPQSLRQRDR